MIITKEMLAGLMFISIGLVAVAVSHGYDLGTIDRFGPGYFPTLVGGVIAVLGAVMVVQGLRSREPREQLARVPLRPLICIMLAVLLFGFLVDRAGLVIALVALIGIAWLAPRERSRVIELVLMTVMLVAFSAGVFVYGLGIPFQLGPQ